MAFYELEPFGWQADFMGHAQTATVVANAHRDPDTTPFKVEDFMPREPEAQTADQMKQVAMMFTAALGGKIGKGNDE